MSDECVFKAGQEYQTRGGYKARVYATDGFGDCPIHGAILLDGAWYLRAWLPSGHYISDAINDTQDLMPPEPEKVTGYVNVYRGETYWANRKEADIAADGATDRIACIRITYHEGQFDE